MIELVKQETQNIINKLNLNCTIEDFENQIDVNWYFISEYQKLSEDFIRKFRNQLNWLDVCEYQQLSENFIREFQDRVDWYNISKYQQLSENFIREFQDRVDWYNISAYQKLSEDFIREFKYEIEWTDISKYQKLSPEFIKEFNLKILKTNWLYKTKEWKLNWIKKHTDYEVVDDQYIIVYKSVELNGDSVYNHKFKYKVGKTYEDFHCDCNNNNENSFGLSAWSKEGALNYYSEGKLLEVKINIEDIGCIIPKNNNKIRCWKLTILKEIQ